MTTTTPQLGSTSSDSCKTDDIIDGIRYLIPSKLLAEYDTASPTDQPHIMEDIFDLMNDIAPTGAYFGSHPDDGACFGFWKD